jgi:hypothetical protein
VNNVIFKYPLELGFNRLELPKGAKVLSLENQREKPVLYAHVDVYSSETEDYQVLAVVTGYPGTRVGDYDFLRTLVFANGGVYHFFIKKV